MAASSQEPTGPEYEQQFLRILNNRSKVDSNLDYPVRRNGFVVLVRGGSNLKPLQDLVLNADRQSYNWCFTARYRLQPTMVFGTLLASWLTDVTRLSGGGLSRPSRDVVGDVRFGPGSSTDGEPEELVTKLSDHPRFASPAGNLTRDFLKVFFGYVSGEGTVQPDQRVVLFAELSEEATDASEWSAAFELFLRNLPERMGIVVSGAPNDFSLPRDDPHFLEIIVPQDYGGPQGEGLLAYKYTDSSFHSDVPAEKDELDVNKYANAIARFVLHPQTKPPIAIGIHGPWGKGKSSFMKLIDSALVKYAEVNRATNTQAWNDIVGKLLKTESQVATNDNQIDATAKERLTVEYESLKEQERALWNEMTAAAQKNVLRIRFNAWQFEDAKQTWAGLASEISEQMEALLPWHARLWLKMRYAWKERKSELVLNVFLPLGIFLVIAGVFAIGLLSGVTVPKVDSGLGWLLRLFLPVGSALITVWYVSSQFVKVAQPISARVLSYVAMPNYREQMGFQHRVKDDLKFVYDFLATRLNTSSFNRAGRFRLVVYIDDLDRCSENKIMELLQAINLILADCEFFVFVGMDTEMIYRAIKSNYKEFTDRFADNYLSKIIQISFHLPDTKLQTRTGYLRTLFSLASRLELDRQAITSGGPVTPPLEEQNATTSSALPYDLTQLLRIVPVQIREAEDTAHELQAFSDYCDFIDDNPREIKRLINIHRLIKILVQKPNTTLDTDRQKKLVKWLIFCDVWPHLVGNAIELATTKPASANCLVDLANKLTSDLNEQKSTDAVPSFDRLSDFAVFVAQVKPQEGSSPAQIDRQNEKFEQDKKIYALSAADIDDDFRLAAKLSQMVRKPAHRT
jgi:KAP family P-loop domain